MSTIKISALPSGNPAQSGDEIPIARSGTSYKITAGSIAGLATAGVQGPPSSVNNQIALFAGTSGDSIQAASTTGVLKATSGVIAAAVSGVDYGDIYGADTICTDNTIVRFDGTTAKTIQKSVATLSDAGVLALPGTANTLSLSGSSTGNPAIIQATGSDSDIELRIRGKGLGGTTLGTANGTALYAGTLGTAVNYFQIVGTSTGIPVILGPEGTDSNISVGLYSKGSSSYFDFFTNTANRQLRISNTNSVANYINVTGATTGNGPEVSAAGSDTNIDLKLTPKGTGAVKFGSSASATSAGFLTANGLTFPAVQVSSADVNTLDDYEEGTWTPIYFSLDIFNGDIAVTYTAVSGQVGRYRKIGAVVFIEFQITTSSVTVTGSTSNELYVDGLPFVPISGFPQNSAIVNIGNSDGWTTNAPSFGYATTITGILLKYKTAPNALTSSLITGANLTNGANKNTIRASGFYLTAT